MLTVTEDGIRKKAIQEIYYSNISLEVIDVFEANPEYNLWKMLKRSLMERSLEYLERFRVSIELTITDDFKLCCRATPQDREESRDFVEDSIEDAIIKCAKEYEDAIIKCTMEQKTKEK